MSRFFVLPESVKGNSIIISGREAHHILDVMRLKISDTVTTFDGTGKEYTGVINAISRGSLTVGIIKTRIPSEKDIARITLIQALPKKEKMDYIVEKSTELGVGFICPVITERTIPDWSETKRQAQAERWTKIAKEAAKQCGRVDVPAISPISKFTDAVKGFSDFDMRLIAVLNDTTIPVKSALAGFKSGNAVIAIGPEGDFTGNESLAAADAGFKAVNLGPRVLKSDTAGLVLLAMMSYELSD
jgi:16S rRNA (uracil1498-N3)-methyltransferase